MPSSVLRVTVSTPTGDCPGVMLSDPKLCVVLDTYEIFRLEDVPFPQKRADARPRRASPRACPRWT